jgi:hypothetical protein
METRGPNSQYSCDIAVSYVTAKDDRPEIAPNPAAFLAIGGIAL